MTNHGISHGNMNIMWIKQCHKAPMTGNGIHATYTNDGDLSHHRPLQTNDDLGHGLLLVYPHYSPNSDNLILKRYPPNETAVWG